MIIATRKSYSVYNLVNGNRELYKIFDNNAILNPGRAFDLHNPYDVFRTLALFCVDGVDNILCGENKEFYGRFLAFVSKPIIPQAFQRVGMGAPYDLVIKDRFYVHLSGTVLEHGYEVVYNLGEAYRLGVIIIEPTTRTILIPGTCSVNDKKVQGISLCGMEVEFDIDDVWAVPKAQYCRREKLEEAFPSYICKRR